MATIIGRAALLRGGNRQAGTVAMYTRCCDETYARAELLKMLERVPTTHNIPADKLIIGIYDIDDSYSVVELKRSYRDRPADKALLMKWYWALRADPKTWRFTEIDLPQVPGARRPGYARLIAGLGVEPEIAEQLLVLDQKEHEAH